MTKVLEASIDPIRADTILVNEDVIDMTNQ